ncbi:MAG: SDR family oxidoreductase, partial [Gammaproteobacteria bacterium]|nr:SDR family oxidoreductase [Gammaproteobacteria bacterium]
SRAAARAMLAAGKAGVIVNASSGAGRRGVPNLSSYCASKAAILMFSQALAIELAPKGIRVNCYAPGHIETPFWGGIAEGFAEVTGASPAEVVEGFRASVPMGRFGTPEDVAATVSWLASDDACADIIQSYIENWAGDALGGVAKEVELIAPPQYMPGSSKNYLDDPSEFEASVYPLLRNFCVDCHTDAAAVPQSPYFASEDLMTAYEAAQPKMDLDNPANSRFVVRLGEEFHNCWSGSCVSDAQDMEDAIQALSDATPVTEVDPSLVTSMALSLPDGIVSSAGGRHETNVIALYEFKTGSGSQAFDTSGVEPSMNMTLSGDYEWVGGWGVSFTEGKAQASTTSSAKLYDLITATGEFSIEAWVAPANVVQDGPARIVTYSGGSMSRNFMLGQTLYQYDALLRHDETDQNGEPRLSTNPDDEDLQATLQHVVMTYDPVNGRRVFVNGQFTEDLDPVPTGLLNEWDNTFAFAVGSEVDNENRWEGTVRLLAVHNRVLTEEQILQNFEVGVGEKYYLLFNVSDHVNIDDAYVVFEVSQFDSYSYLFDEPFFIILDSSATPGSIQLAGMRIGLNGREVAISQAFRNLDVTVTDADYEPGAGQVLSTLGTIVPLEQGPAVDEFFLTFERLGDATNVVVEPTPVAPPAPADVPPAERTPPHGIRDFAEVNATMAKLTGVPASNAEVSETYNLVYQAMPVQPNLGGFISSQQMGITQLAIKYCSVLVEDTSLRAQFWPAFTAWSAQPGTAFGGDRSAVIDPIIDNTVGRGIATQPDEADLYAEIDALIDRLAVCNNSCPSDRTENIMKASCAAALGSAAMLVQ